MTTPILRLKAYILENSLAENDALDAIDDAVKQDVLDSVTFAESSPAPSLEEIYDDIYEESNHPFLA